MAKKDEGSEGYDFVPPDFNEDAFIHREMVEYKTTMIRTAVAIVAALVSWGLFWYFQGDDSKAWPAGLAVCIAFGLALKPIFARFTDITIYKRMDWVGTGFVFFLTWLAFFLVAVNPPLSDFSPPQVLVTADPPVQAAGGVVDIAFLATDNSHLSAPPQFTVLRNGQPVDVPGGFAPATADGGHYSAKLANPTTIPGDYQVTVQATDGRGHSTSAQANFTVKADALLKVTLPRDGKNLTGADEILVQLDAQPCMPTLPPCIRTVFFEAAGKPSVPFEYNDAKKAWYATASFEGWQAGETTGKVVAEFMDHHQGTSTIKGGRLESAESYTLQVEPPAGDRHTVSVLPTAGAPPVNVPGYGFIGLVVALLGVALVVRRRGE